MRAMRWLALTLALLGCGRTAVYRERVEPGDAGAGCAPGEPCSCLPGFEEVEGQCVSVAVRLDGLRWELPCLRLPADFPEYICFTSPAVSTSTRISGARSKQYVITLRLRGVLETKAYTGGTREAGPVLRGGTPSQDDWNVYRLEVSSPAQTWHLNAGTSGDYACVPVDVELEVLATGGATFTLFASPVDDRLSQIRNRGVDGGAFVIEGVPPAPLPFDGQFLQMDVLGVRERP